jgi:hypothetical protein
MASNHTPADDLVYDLVSVQYHALKAAQTYDQYISDADGHPEVVKFLKQAKKQDAGRAEKCHELLRDLTKDHGIG